MNRKRFHLPISILLLNLILAIFPIISGSLIYNRILNVVTEDLVESNLRVMKQNLENFEKNYSNLGKSIFPLQDNISVIRCKNLTDPFSEGNVIRLLDCFNDFSMIMSSQEDDKIIDSFLYFCTNDVVITPLSIYRGDNFFDTQFELLNNDIEAWREELKNSYYSMKLFPQQNIIYKEEEYNVNLFVHSLSHDQKNTEVYFIALIESDFFMEKLDRINFSEGDSFNVFNEGNLLFQQGEYGGYIDNLLKNPQEYKDTDGYETINENNSEKLITYAYSLLRKTSFIMEQSSLDELSTILKNMKRIVIYGGIFYLFFASIFTYILTRRNRVTLLSSHTIAKQQLISGLYNGSIVNRDEMEESWTLLRLSHDEVLWGMVHIAINPFDSNTTTEILIKHNMELSHLQERITKLMPSLYTLHIPDTHRLRLFLVHGFSENELSRANSIWKEELDKLYEFFSQEKEFTIYMGYGLLQSDRMQLFVSHAQARQALNSILKRHEPGIEQYQEKHDDTSIGSLPENIFSILEVYLFQGDLEGIDNVFDTLRNILFDPQLTFVMCQYLITKIYGVIIEMTEKSGRENLICWSPEFFSKIKTLEGIDELFSSLKDKTKITGTQITNKKKSHNTDLLNLILQDIEKNLDNQNLNAAVIATNHKITETYLYQFFKEQTGITFASYMESQRMEKARFFLDETDYSIKEISQRVGYGSSNTLGRAFKRNYGLSASDYRESRVKNG